MFLNAGALSVPPLPDPVVAGGATATGALVPPTPLAPSVGPELVLNRPMFPQIPSVTWPWKVLRCGCYLISYRPVGSSLVAYDGTMRVECATPTSRTASGDLYQRPVTWISLPWPFLRRFPIMLPGPTPAGGIPVLARAQYRTYLRVTQLAEWLAFGGSFTLGFDMHQFNQATRTWTADPGYTAQMTWMPAPSGYPSSGDYLEGDVKNASGVIVGRLTMGWVSDYLRRATIEIDRVSAAEAPLGNGAGVDWRAVGNLVGWDLTVDVSDADVAEPSGESWSDAELHAAMLARRDSADLDAEWRYHVLAVRLIDSTPRGIMYDAYAGDSNNIPREGAGIASHWIIPNADPWGQVKGQRVGTVAPVFFRTAVHEIGHAMGLYHNTIDNGFMNTTDVIASSGTAATPFPTNVVWSYAADDAFRLRHMPDVYVRPGGTPFGTSYATTPISPADLAVPAEGLVLRATPTNASVPLGAPVRVELRLENVSDAPVEAPVAISLGSGFTRGEVVDPSGVARTFSPLVLCLDDQTLVMLDPGGAVEGSLTLLRGGAGALFPAPGLYTIRVEVHWSVGELEATVLGETTAMVTSIVDEAHGEAARAVLSEPDTLLVVAVGGDHLEDGIAAVHTALDNDVLRPHFEYTEARRLARRFGDRPPDPIGAVAALSTDTVVNADEAKKIEQMADKAKDAAVEKAASKTATAAKKAPATKKASATGRKRAAPRKQG